MENRQEVATRFFAGLVIFIVWLPFAGFAQDLNDELWAAARKGDAPAVKVLLAKGADVNAKFRYNATALSYAADRGHLEVVKVLVEHGAELNIKDTFYNSPPLSWAAYNGHTEVVKFLLEKGAEGKETALMSGIESNNLEMVKAALAVGGIKDETLTSALARATQGNKTEIVEALKKAGAAPAKVPDFKINPALLQNYAGRYKNDEIGMEMTFTVQNDKFIGTVSGQPPLTYAPVDNNNFKAVEFSGIDITFNSTGNQVTDFTLKQGGRSFVFKKVKAEEKVAEPKSAEVEKKETKAESAMATTASKAKKNGVAVAKNWPSFRGMFATGVADGQNPPTTWNAEKSLNIKWKTPIPGMAHSSPVIWGNRVFITTAITSDTSSKLRVGLYGDVAPDKDISKHTWKVY
ncbi:MAG: ankyrin repeat domain-containing protein, partial [bacterium]